MDIIIYVLPRTKVLREPGQRFRGHKDMPVAPPLYKWRVAWNLAYIVPVRNCINKDYILISYKLKTNKKQLPLSRKKDGVITYPRTVMIHFKNTSATN